VYLPGAGLLVGDVHAAQSDGEGVCPMDINATVTMRLERIAKGQTIVVTLSKFRPGRKKEPK
jgi:acetamidase/formamidase